MHTDNQNLISLSLAGSVGYYLYSKLASVGAATLFGAEREPAVERTRRELAIMSNADVQIDNVEASVEDMFDNPVVLEEQPQALQPVEESVFKSQNDEVAPDVESIDDELSELANPVATEEPVLGDTLDVSVPDLIFNDLEPAVLTDDALSVPELDSELSPINNETVPNTPVTEPIEAISEPEDETLAIPNMEPDDTGLDVSLLDTEDETPIDNLFEAISETDQDVNAIPMVEAEPLASLLPDVESDIANVEPVTPAMEPIVSNVSDNNPAINENMNSLDNLDSFVAPPLIETPPVVNEPVVTTPNPITPEPVAPATSPIEDISSNSITPQDTKSPIMENVETLHRVDQQDKNAKDEYKSIMDFFSSL